VMADTVAETAPTPTRKRDAPTPPPGQPALKRQRPASLNPESLQLKTELTGHTGPVSSLKISPDGSLIASSSADKTVRIWNINSGDCTLLRGHTKGVNDCAWAPNNRVASGGDDNDVRFWDISAPDQGHVLSGHTNPVFCVRYDASGTYLASGSYDNTIRLWDAKTGTFLRELSGHTEPVTSLDFVGQNTLISGSYDGLIHIWDVASGTLTKTLNDGSCPISNLRVHSTFVLVSRLDGIVRLWKEEFGHHVIREYSGHINKKYCLGTTLLRSQHIVSGSEDNKIYIWSVQSSKVEKILEGHTGPVMSVDSSKERNILVSGSMDKTVKIWNFTTK